VSSGRRRPLVPAVVAAAMASALGACGSAGRTTHTSIPPGPAGSTSAAQSTSTTEGTVSASTTTSASTRRGPELPAEFKIEPGGTLSPARISAPPHTAIALSLISSGGSYVIALGTPHAQSYAVSGDHPVHAILNGLANGTYAIEVDGHPRGQLIVGAAPGP
jgi:hypothetical protein